MRLQLCSGFKDRFGVYVLENTLPFKDLGSVRFIEEKNTFIQHGLTDQK